MTTLASLLGGIRSPLHNNILASAAMAVYYKAAIEASCFLRQRWKYDGGISRNVLHLSFSSVVVFWPYFDRSDWSWKLAALLPAVMLARLVYKGMVLKDPTDVDVQNLSLSSSPTELLLGPLILAGVFLWLTLHQFMTEEAAIVAAVSFGDGLAPVIGSRWGRHIYSVPFSKLKTMEGSVVGVFLGTVFGCYFFLYMMGIPFLPLRMILAYAGIAAVAEGTSPGNLDNLVTSLVLHFSIERVKLLMPP
jgi:phytol kinase